MELDNAAKDGGGRNDKRAKKDAKFGFGGKKRHAKSNDAASTSDLTGFSSRKMKGQQSKTGGGGGAKARPGKARRASAK